MPKTPDRFGQLDLRFVHVAIGGVGAAIGALGYDLNSVVFESFKLVVLTSVLRQLRGAPAPISRTLNWLSKRIQSELNLGFFWVGIWNFWNQKAEICMRKKSKFFESKNLNVGRKNLNF